MPPNEQGHVPQRYDLISVAPRCHPEHIHGWALLSRWSSGHRAARRRLIVSDLVAGGPDFRMADNKTMRAWLMDSYDGVEKLRLADVDEAAPGPGDVLVGIRFAALNPADAFLSIGQYPARPKVPHIWMA